MKSIMLKASVPYLSIHELRHTASSFMANQGIPQHLHKEVMGHSKISTTMELYTHVHVDQLKASLSAVAKVPKRA